MLNSSFSQIQVEIRRLADEKGIVILAHNYQRGEIQDVAHFTGDSLQMAKFAVQTSGSAILVCGVRFMAETAAILNPRRHVYIPEPDAGCPMANMIDENTLRRLRLENPTAVVVCYVNSSAEVKALSDICCTSSNAVRVVASIPKEKPVLFIPDQNLGGFVKRSLNRENMILFPGYCHVHNYLNVKSIKELKESDPDSILLMHPECTQEALKLADHIASTGQMIEFVKKSQAKSFIIVTEREITYPLKKANPDKKFIHPDPPLLCPNMKLTTIQKVLEAVKSPAHRVTVSESVRISAVQALNRMLEV
ncbi:quinolinate synthase NadA [bacterium]|nr:quinolinate synthase NadA [bacterium]